MTGLASASLWRYASGGGRLLAEGLDERLTRYLLQRSLVVPIAFALSIAAALASLAPRRRPGS
jgi:hypothetical protein